MIKVTAGDIGRYVIYKPSVGKEQRGRIKSFNDAFVFVVYHCNEEWDKYQDYTGCATKREDLKYAD